MKKETLKWDKLDLKRFAQLCTGFIAICTGITFGLTIDDFYEKKKDNALVTIEGQVTDDFGKPWDLKSLELRDDNGSEAFIYNNGKFIIKNVLRSSIKDYAHLRFELNDSSFYEAKASFIFDRHYNTLNLNMIKIDRNGSIPETYEKPNPSLLASNTYVIGVVNTRHHALNLRSAPSQSSSKIGTIPRNAQVQIQRYVGNTLIINGLQGKWCYISYNGVSGYVFGGYLLEQSTI